MWHFSSVQSLDYALRIYLFFILYSGLDEWFAFCTSEIPFEAMKIKGYTAAIEEQTPASQSKRTYL